jgi:hypothetical protein
MLWKKAFVKGAFTPSTKSGKIDISVHFAMQKSTYQLEENVEEMMKRVAANMIPLQCLCWVITI